MLWIRAKISNRTSISVLRKVCGRSGYNGVVRLFRLLSESRMTRMAQIAQIARNGGRGDLAPTSRVAGLGSRGRWI